MFGFVSVSCFCASAKDIRVQLVNAKSGKPLTKVRVAMSSWNGVFDVHQQHPPQMQIAVATSDTQGVAVFQLPLQIPEHIGFDIGGLREFAGCWRLSGLTPEKVLQSGVVADYNEPKCGKLTMQFTAKPGEVIIIDKKLTLRERMREEIP
jgi:hypothetical protein